MTVTFTQTNFVTVDDSNLDNLGPHRKKYVPLVRVEICRWCAILSKRVPIQFPGSGRKSLVKTTLQRGSFTAELYLDRKTSPPIYHYVVTRKDSAEIIAWGQVPSKAEAEAQALETMDQLSKGLRKSASTG